MEKFTPLAKILHCHRQWRQWQISPLVMKSNLGWDSEARFGQIFQNLSSVEKLMFGWDFKNEIWSRFVCNNLWYDLRKLLCEDLSTLGSDVPMAMFLFNSLSCLLQRDVLWKRRNPTSCLVLTGGQPVVTVCVFTTDIRHSCFCFAQTLNCRKNIVLNNSSSNAEQKNWSAVFFAAMIVFTGFSGTLQTEQFLLTNFFPSKATTAAG